MKNLLLGLLFITAASGMTIEDAKTAVIEHGSLRAAKLLGEASIPLPKTQVRANASMLEKMWAAGQANRINRSLLASSTPIESLPLSNQQVTENTESIQGYIVDDSEEQKRQVLQVCFEREQQERKDHLANKMKQAEESAKKIAERDAEFEAGLSETYRLEWERQKAEKEIVQERLEEEERERFIQQQEKWQTKKKNRRYDLECVEAQSRKGIENQYFNTPRIYGTYDEMLLALAAQENAQKLYDIAKAEKEKKLQRIENQWVCFRNAFFDVKKTGNYRNFFQVIISLETEDDDFLHLFKTAVQDFWQKKKIKDTRKSDPFLLDTLCNVCLDSSEPFFDVFERVGFFPFFGIDPSKECCNPVASIRRLHHETYGLTRLTFPPCAAVFFPADNVLSMINKRKYTFNTETPWWKKTKYLMAKAIIDGDSEILIDWLNVSGISPKSIKTEEEIEKLKVLNLVAFLIFRERHDTAKVTQAMRKYSAFHHEYLRNSSYSINSFLDVIQEMNYTKYLTIPHFTFLTCFDDFEGWCDLPLDPARPKCTVDKNALAIFIWERVVTMFSSFPPRDRSLCGSGLGKSLKLIYEHFGKVEKICLNNGLSDQERAKKYVLDYEAQFKTFSTPVKLNPTEMNGSIPEIMKAIWIRPVW